jgi:hypothetical protein
MKNKMWAWVVVVILLIAVGIWYYQNDTHKTMRVMSAQPFNSGQYSSDSSLKEMGSDNIKVLFKGPATLTGNFFFEASESGFAGYCMKDFDISFLGTLPYEISPEKIKVFCFRNTEEVDQKLGKEAKKITVTIDNFELNSYPAEVMNWADFVDVRF